MVVQPEHLVTNIYSQGLVLLNFTSLTIFLSKIITIHFGISLGARIRLCQLLSLSHSLHSLARWNCLLAEVPADYASS